MATKRIPPKSPVKRPGTPARPTPPAAPRQPLTHLFQPGFWQQHRLPALVLLAIALVLYGITVTYGYLQDDQLVIWDNIFVQKGFAGLRDIFANDSLLGYYKEKKLLLEGGRYRPLPLLTYALEIGIFGKDSPGVSHLVNVLLYGATGVLLYRILLGLFPVRAGGAWFFSLAFLTAGIFLLHPLHVEAVANIKGRDEILALLGSLGALYGTLKYFDTARNRWLLAAGFSLFLGLLSKENAFTFLAVIPLTLAMFTRIPVGRIVGACLPLAVAALAYMLVRYGALGYMIYQGKPMDDLVHNPFVGMSALEKYATIFLSLGWYLKLLFVPHPLTHDYYPFHVPRVGWDDWRAVVSLVIYVAMGLWAVWQYRKTRRQPADLLDSSDDARLPAYCILYYLLTISVVSNLFAETSTFMNERLAYMPSVAFCLLAAWFLSRKLPEWLGKSPDRPYLVGVGLASVLVLLFGLRVWTRVPDWGGDGSRLVETAIRIAPNSYRANYYYAFMLYNEKYLKINEKATAERENLLDQTERYLHKALEIYPNYTLGITLKSKVAVERYRLDGQLDKLLKDFEAMIQKQPYNGDMLVVVLDALKSIKNADPNIYDFFCHRIGYNLYFKQKRDFNGAAEFLNLALNNYPQDQNIMQDLVEVYTAMGNPAKVAEMQQRLQSLQAQ